MPPETTTLGELVHEEMMTVDGLAASALAGGFVGHVPVAAPVRVTDTGTVFAPSETVTDCGEVTVPEELARVIVRMFVLTVARNPTSLAAAE